jgi:predicted metal-dependent hydrolase
MAAHLDVRQRALFAPPRFEARPSAVARLRALARSAADRPWTPRTRTDEDAETLERLRGMAVQLAAHFELRYTAIDAEADGVVQHYGICYADGRIRIRLRHASTGKLLKASSLVDTLCHELGHLRHFDHSIRFRRFHQRVLSEARRRGWYKPGPAPKPAPQRALLDIGTCGTLVRGSGTESTAR